MNLQPEGAVVPSLVPGIQRALLDKDVSRSNILLMVRLPSIQTLRAFDAAGRHQSYSRAAEELALTHGAISHRIRELEAQTRTRLFERRGNRMVPTRDGHRLLAHVRHALGILEGAFGEPPASAEGTVTVSLLPAVASRWLMSRMAGFRRVRPDIEVRLRVEVELTDFRQGTADAAIRFGPGGWPDVRAEFLAGELLFPMCAPEFRDRWALGDPAELGRVPVLRHEWQPWGPWFRAAGLDMPEPVSAPGYADPGMLLQAAAAGEGVALGRGMLAVDDLRSGRLVRLFDLAVRDAYGYHFVRPAGGAASPAVTAFGKWLRNEMETDAHWLEDQLDVVS